ncbi:MAG: hypothetical protein NC485_13185 [Ruminococcus flavefaciens]|nr:hypothetical protein [Ruminococcus flavefaciens]MCM1060571.1 hypothetical protein [Eubacterium sp.]
MSDKTKKSIVARHKKVAFYGVLSSDRTEKFLRMPKFTQLSQSKNPIEYSRQYVDEPFQETDITGYSPSISYAFDLHRNCEVLSDIVGITDNELIADDAVRNIVIVDVDEGTAIKRSYAVIPSNEGDNINIYTYSGTFKCKGEKIHGTATSEDNWQTITFKPETSG